MKRHTPFWYIIFFRRLKSFSGLIIPDMCTALGLLFLSPFISQAQETDFNLKNAGDYNNFIMKEMTSTVQKNFEYISFSVHSEEYDQLEIKRKEVVIEIVRAKDHIAQMPPLEGDTRLRDEAVTVLDEYQHAFELDSVSGAINRPFGVYK